MSAEHGNKKYSIFQVAGNLTLACLISGIIIAVTYYVTAPVAAQKAILIRNNSMKALVKEAETFQPVQGKEGWFTAQKGGKKIAYIVPSESKGYGGIIKMLVAVTPKGKVIDFDIESANETPGLGDNASKEPFRGQFRGKTDEHLTVVKDPSKKEDIQAMTGATISSRAVTKGVKEAVDKVLALGGK